MEGEILFLEHIFAKMFRTGSQSTLLLVARIHL